MSLFRISLICSSYCLFALAMLPALGLAQQNFSYPSTGVAGFGSSGDGGFGVSPPSYPDTQVQGFADHRSMSPDSWSAPPTGPTIVPAIEAPVQAFTQNASTVQTPTLDSQFSQTPSTAVEAGQQIGFYGMSGPNNAPSLATKGTTLGRSVLNPGVKTESNFFPAKQPGLLKFDGEDAFSSATADVAETTGTPDIPELQKESPFKLAKTQSEPQPESYQLASKQSGFQGGVNASQPELYSQMASQYTAPYSPQYTAPHSAPLAPPQGVVSRYPLQGTTPVQDSAYPSSASSVQPQPQFGNQHGFNGPAYQQPAQQTAPRSWAYPTQQESSVPATQGFFSQQSSVLQTPMTSHLTMHNPLMPNGQTFRPDLGHRSPTPTIRNFGSYDNGQKFEFEDKKKQYPPLSEILATGRYFGSVATRYVRLHAQNNTAFTTTSPTFAEGIAFDYDFEFTSFIRFGFESKFGPGIEFDYFKYDGRSNQAQFTSNGTVTGQVQTLGASASQFGAFNAGETLSARHNVNFETFGISFFKEVKLPISRINGRFGFQYVSIAQDLDANLTNATGELGTFNSRSDFRGLGPKFTLEYYRPVGHTPLEFVTSVAGGVMYGRRDEFVDNTLGSGFSRAGSDEFLTTIEFNSGVQFKHNLAENRSVFVRVGTTYSTFIGGGTAIDPQSDFGLRGFSLAVGYNR